MSTDAILQPAAGVTAEVHLHSLRPFPLMVFTIASILQFACHRHLASLRKYSLPTNFLFRYVICPHYLMECIIYLSLARIAAPADRLFNATLLCVTTFVAINLSVVADSTREWWRTKFGEAAVLERYRMFPLIW
jgi:3-oxo-5-alpha-steroid 4-dehydrogenase 3 / polyprenol reductase